MTYAFVTTNLLDMWAVPQFNSERVNQAFFGETVSVGVLRHGYRRVTQADGYHGWADERFIRKITRSQAQKYRREQNAVVTSQQVCIYDKGKRSSQSPHFLYYGTRFHVRSYSGGFARILLADGTVVYLKSGAIRPIKGKKTRSVTGTGLVAEAKRFLGIPYLWGGISPAGFDCSGLIRTVFGRFGVDLSRDTKDQIKFGRVVERDHAKAGDLLFFDRHVALAMGRERIIHASVGGGGVRINSLNPGDEDYRADLDRDFVVAKRIL